MERKIASLKNYNGNDQFKYYEQMYYILFFRYRKYKSHM